MPSLVCSVFVIVQMTPSQESPTFPWETLVISELPKSTPSELAVIVIGRQFKAIRRSTCVRHNLHSRSEHERIYTQFHHKGMKLCNGIVSVLSSDVLIGRIVC